MTRRCLTTAVLALFGASALGIVASPAAAETEAAPDAAMASWHAALAGAESEPADVLFVGDSITEGFGASGRDEWWVDEVRGQLQSHVGGGGIGYLPASHGMAGEPWPSLVTFEDGQPHRTSGLGLRSRLLDQPSARLEATVTADAVQVLYTAGPQLGAMQVAIDGDVVATVDTYSSTQSGGASWRSGALEPGSHVVTITPAPGGQIPDGAVVVEGLAVFDGDAERGVRIWDGSHAGFGTDHYVDEPAWADSVHGVDPELLVIALGTNDYMYGTTPAQLEANIGEIIDGVTAASTGPVSVLLVPVWTGADRDAARYGELVEAQQRIAAERGLAVVDLSHMPAIGVTADGIHPDDSGQDVLANAVLTRIDPAYEASTVPLPAGEVSVADADGGSVAATWPPSADADRYVVTLRDADAGLLDQRIVGEPTATFADLGGGRSYVVGVQAGNAAGYSTVTESAALLLPATTVQPPSNPTGLTAGAGSVAGTAELTWTAPAGAVSSYLLLTYDTATGYVGQQSVTGTSTTVAGLSSGRSYVFGLHAHNAAGYSPGVASNVVTLAGIVVVPPTAPAGVTAELESEPDTLLLTWTAPQGVVTDYTVQLFDTATGFVRQQVVTGTSATFSGLVPGHSYVLGVYARNTAGYSPGVASNVVTVPGVVVTAPGNPTQVVAVAGSAAGTMDLSWTAPGGPVDSYVVVAYDTVTGYVGVQTVTTTSATFTGLVPGRSYVFGLYAGNSAGYSAGVASKVVRLPRS